MYSLPCEGGSASEYKYVRIRPFLSSLSNTCMRIHHVGSQPHHEVILFRPLQKKNWILLVRDGKNSLLLVVAGHSAIMTEACASAATISNCVVPAGSTVTGEHTELTSRLFSSAAEPCAVVAKPEVEISGHGVAASFIDARSRVDSVTGPVIGLTTTTGKANSSGMEADPSTRAPKAEGGTTSSSAQPWQPTGLHESPILQQ